MGNGITNDPGDIIVFHAHTRQLMGCKILSRISVTSLSTHRRDNVLQSCCLHFTERQEKLTIHGHTNIRF
jgi:hypothetical protein